MCRQSTLCLISKCLVHIILRQGAQIQTWHHIANYNIAKCIYVQWSTIFTPTKRPCNKEEMWNMLKPIFQMLVKGQSCQSHNGRANRACLVILIWFVVVGRWFGLPQKPNIATRMCDVWGVPDVSLNVCALGNVSSLTGVAASLQRNTRSDRHCRLPVSRGCRESLCKSAYFSML